MHSLNNPLFRSIQIAAGRCAIYLSILVLVPYVYAATRPLLWPAVVIVAFGEFLQLWAAANLNKNAFVAHTGPYVLMRNPMYAGRFFVILGCLLLVGHHLYVIPAFVALYVIYVQSRVLREEDRLRADLGEPYIDYCRRVNRWLPVKRLPGGKAVAWSWQYVRQNRQLYVSAGLALMMVLVYVRQTMLLTGLDG